MKQVKQYLHRFLSPYTKKGAGTTLDRVCRRRSNIGSHKRLYRLYLPKSYRKNKALPLVLVLHGCRQTHQDIQHLTNFDALADREKFILVYPFVTHYNDLRAQNCWGWWRPEHVQKGRGEVQDLWHIVEDVCDEFAVNKKRIHIVGLSSGGGMTTAALTVHAGKFASGAVVAGLAYGESVAAVTTTTAARRRYQPIDRTLKKMARARDNNKQPAALCVVHSHDDKMVHIEAGHNLRDSWLQYFGLSANNIRRRRNKHSNQVDWEHSFYGQRFKKSLVETIYLNGPDHGWVGGIEGDYSFPEGPNISKLIWDFLKRHPQS